MVVLNKSGSLNLLFYTSTGTNLGFQVRRPKYKKKKNPNKYPYSTNKLLTKINTQNHYFLINMKTFTKKDQKKKKKIIFFFKSINYCKKKKIIKLKIIFTNQNLLLLF